MWPPWGGGSFLVLFYFLNPERSTPNTMYNVQILQFIFSTYEAKHIFINAISTYNSVPLQYRSYIIRIAMLCHN